MSTYTTKDLLSVLKSCEDRQFSGYLAIASSDTEWQLHYLHGRLIGNGGGVHPVRRWRRLLSQFCPQLGDCADDILAAANWGHKTLQRLVQQRDLARELAMAVIEQGLTETLYDLLRYQASPNAEPLTLLAQPHITPPGLPLSLLKLEQLLPAVQAQLAAWQVPALQKISLDLAPVIKDPARLQQEVSPAAFRNLSSLIDGDRTLRDLAVKVGQDPVILMQSLMPYLQRQLITFQPVADIAVNVEPVTSIRLASAPMQKKTSELIAYIDDSPADGRTMGQVLTTAGYRYIHVQDPLQALPNLLEHKPSLIFLDLVMPIANGYEICSQIRRISLFKDTPVVIVTSSDGIVDRVRAKVAGASGFLGKPIQAEKVLAILEKMLSQPQAAPAAPAPAATTATASFQLA